MKEKGLTRRAAMGRMAKLMAGTVGLSAAASKRLLALSQMSPVTQPGSNLEKLVGIKASMLEAKSLKIFVFPRQDVFLNEFGRNVEFHWQDFLGGDCGELISIGNLAFSSDGECGTNLCDRQNCTGLTWCSGTNDCGSQQCPGLKMPSNSINHPNLYSAASLDRMRTDPFVAALFKAFGTTDSRVLSQQLVAMVSQRRQAIR